MDRQKIKKKAGKPHTFPSLHISKQKGIRQIRCLDVLPTRSSSPLILLSGFSKTTLAIYEKILIFF